MCCNIDNIIPDFYLALLSLGVRNIHTNPTFPVFFTPDILKILQEEFNINTISTVEDDIDNLIDN